MSYPFLEGGVFIPLQRIWPAYSKFPSIRLVPSLRSVTNPGNLPCPVEWGFRIYQLLLCWGVRPPPYECPGYNTKQFDSEVPVLQEIWRTWSAPSLPLLPNSLWPGVVVPERVLSMGQIELKCVFKTLKLCVNKKLYSILNWTVWKRMFLYAKLTCLKENCLYV